MFDAVSPARLDLYKDKVKMMENGHVQGPVTVTVEDMPGVRSALSASFLTIWSELKAARGPQLVIPKKITVPLQAIGAFDQARRAAELRFMELAGVPEGTRSVEEEMELVRGVGRSYQQRNCRNRCYRPSHH